MLPHFGHATISPIESALRTASRAPQVVHEMENSVFCTITAVCPDRKTPAPSLRPAPQPFGSAVIRCTLGSNA